MKRILVWGFYNQGNLGDDLMAAIFSEMLEQLGHIPVIYSSNFRIKDMGYNTVSTLDDLEVDSILLGGGAFFKKGGSSNSAIEQSINQLASFIIDKKIPVFGLSLGSDGIRSVSEVSVQRKRILESPHFQGAVVRLKRDLNLKLKNLYYLPDIVLLTKYCCESFPRLHPLQVNGDYPEFLINLSRRSMLHLPCVLYMARAKKSAFFRAHTGFKKTGGEVTLPVLPIIDNNNICAELGYLRMAKTIASSKLHPGIIAMSFGTNFIPIGARDKVKEFMNQDEYIFINNKAAQVTLWQDYCMQVNNFLTIPVHPINQAK